MAAQVFAFERSLADRRLVVVANVSGTTARVSWPVDQRVDGVDLLTDRPVELAGPRDLAPHETLVVRPPRA